MATAAQTTPFTFEDFCFLVREKQKADLIDGVIYMASPENFDAHRLFQLLYVLLVEFVEETDVGGVVVGSRVAFRIDGINGPEPDVAYVSPDHGHRLRPGYVEGPPDLAVEIVSPESVE